MKSICTVSILWVMIVCNPDYLFAQNTWLNPGIKLGHTFGPNGGFTWGFEVSLTFQQDVSGGSNFYGIVVDVDNRQDLRTIHVGAQFSTKLFLGLCVGPTWISENGESDVGLSLIPFAGAFVYPYYNYTYRPKKANLHEIGGYLKLPLLVAGKIKM